MIQGARVPLSFQTEKNANGHSQRQAAVRLRPVKQMNVTPLIDVLYLTSHWGRKGGRVQLASPKTSLRKYLA